MESLSSLRKSKPLRAQKSLKVPDKKTTEPNSSTLNIFMKTCWKVGKVLYMMCPAMEKCCPFFVKAVPF